MLSNKSLEEDLRQYPKLRAKRDNILNILILPECVRSAENGGVEMVFWDHLELSVFLHKLSPAKLGLLTNLVIWRLQQFGFEAHSTPQNCKGYNGIYVRWTYSPTKAPSQVSVKDV